MFGNHGLCGLPEEGAHEKSPKCLGWEFRGFGGDFAKVSAFQTTLMQIRFKELLKLIKRNLASGVVIQIRVVRARHAVQFFVFAAQRFERIGELTVEDGR